MISHFFHACYMPHLILLYLPPPPNYQYPLSFNNSAIYLF